MVKWDKHMAVRKRQRLILRSTNSKSMSGKYLEAAKYMKNMAKNSDDRAVKREAMKDSNHFLIQHRRLTNK